MLPVPGRADAWIAMFDINQPKDPVNSGYIWLPLEFSGNSPPTIHWKTDWTLDGMLNRPR